MSLRQHILVPIDSFILSNDALRTIRNVSFDYADITLLYVYDPLNLKSPVTLVLEPNKNGLPQCIAQELLERLRQMRQAELKDFNKVNLEIVVSRDPAEAICQLAMRQRVDLLIIATQICRGISCLSNECVTENVIRRARCPVLIIHPRGLYAEERSPGRLPLVSRATA